MTIIFTSLTLMLLLLFSVQGIRTVFLPEDQYRNLFISNDILFPFASKHDATVIYSFFSYSG